MDLAELQALETYLKGRLSLQIENVRHGLRRLAEMPDAGPESGRFDAVYRIDQALHQLASEAVLFLDEAAASHRAGVPLEPGRSQHGIRAAIARCHAVHEMDL